MTPKQRAEEIVRQAWDRAPHLQLETVLIEAIEAAIKEKKIKMPSESECKDASLEWFRNVTCNEACSGGFKAAVDWMRDEILRRNS